MHWLQNGRKLVKIGRYNFESSNDFESIVSQNSLWINRFEFWREKISLIYKGTKLIKIGRYNFESSNDFEPIVSQNSLCINRFEFWREKKLVNLQRQKTRQNKAV